MQWKEMSWPVYSDPYNQLGVKAVPITLLIDEGGVIRYRNPKADDLKEFLATEKSEEAGYPEREAEIFEIKRLENDVQNKPSDALTWFQLGVAYRARFDSGKGESDDFGKAISSWQKALGLRPDQYIWRRRIQQYGPRLDKPYSFYDWVNRARKEISARGEEPLPLVAEPGGSEFAHPGRANGPVKVPEHPDPNGKVSRDPGELVKVEAVVVPSTKKAGEAVRVHLRFIPNEKRAVHWTNDAGNLTFFAHEEKVKIVDREGPGELPAVPSSHEVRTVEFEVRPGEGGKLPRQLKAEAFYFVCEGAMGVCRFLRQDLLISLRP